MPTFPTIHACFLEQRRARSVVWPIVVRLTELTDQQTAFETVVNVAFPERQAVVRLL